MKKILLGVNFEEESASAVEDAYLLANRYDGVIIPIHAVEYLPLGNKQSETELLMKQIDKRMNDIADKLRVRGIEVYEPVIEKGDTLTVLKSACEVVEADVLVIGAGVNDDEHHTLGVTAKAIVRNSPVPVWVSNVKTDIGEYSEIACAVDLSPRSQTTLEDAVSLAKVLDAKLHVLHVENGEFYYPGLFDSQIPVYHWALADYTRDLAAKDLDDEKNSGALPQSFRDFIKKADFMGVDTEIHLKTGQASREILDFAQSYNIGILVMGKMGKTDFLQKLLGGTVEKVLDRLPLYNAGYTFKI